MLLCLRICLYDERRGVTPCSLLLYLTHQYKGESQCKQSFAKVKEFIRLIDLGDKVMSS